MDWHVTSWKRVYAKSVSRVRISLTPQDRHAGYQFIKTEKPRVYLLFV